MEGFDFLSREVNVAADIPGNAYVAGATLSNDFPIVVPAIQDANANSGTDTIEFDIGGGGPRTIQPTSALPTILEAVIIDGGRVRYE